jgi:hypothetical protein
LELAIKEAAMTTHRLYRVSSLALCTLVVVLSSVRFARAQFDARPPSQSEALSTAVKANPQLVKELAKQLGSTPEEAAGTAGALFSVVKSFLKPEDFETVAKAVPGMDALLAVVPQDVAGTSAAPAVPLTPGFASSSASPISLSPTTSSPATSPPMPVTMAAPNGVASAISVLSKMGINPGMVAKAIPFLTGYLKKNGGKGVGALIGQVFKTGK